MKLSDLYSIESSNKKQNYSFQIQISQNLWLSNKNVLLLFWLRAVRILKSIKGWEISFLYLYKFPPCLKNDISYMYLYKSAEGFTPCHHPYVIKKGCISPPWKSPEGKRQGCVVTGERENSFPIKVFLFHPTLIFCLIYLMLHEKCEDLTCTNMHAKKYMFKIWYLDII